jgi:hypothetical protein
LVLRYVSFHFDDTVVEFVEHVYDDYGMMMRDLRLAASMLSERGG